MAASASAPANPVAPALHALNALVPTHPPWMETPESREHLEGRVKVARWGSIAGAAMLLGLVYWVFDVGSSLFPGWPMEAWSLVILWTVGALVDLGIAISVTGAMLLSIEEENDGSHFFQSSLLGSALGMVLGGVFPGVLLFRAHQGFFGPPPKEPAPKPKKEEDKEKAKEAPLAPSTPSSAGSAAPAPPPPPPTAVVTPPPAAPPPPPPPPSSYGFVSPGAPPGSSPPPSPRQPMLPTVLPPVVDRSRQEPLGPPSCPSCGLERRPGDVTCRQCGAFLPM
ncbi:MAG: zinc ribbon domain-containing protein [Euryarchaeota archaeon]|nr:zinc ribbon domain-containing protein [Euryarchaeota archaeon]MDE1836899.1 zinc ribbon domain-containing protein [Euryarchaeota archaeon]MDE1881712.1 zinc ribbon domain-containing protein [Euryarchaeota archaeon]MDE2045302.1 zinc ribbon domain-containing protein [Thermoplasmata archaeon]